MLVLLLLTACSDSPVSAADGDSALNAGYDRIVAEVRSQLFEGPVAALIDLDRLDPRHQSPANRLGLTARWTYDPEVAVAYIRAAGIKWLRLGIDEHAQAVLDMARENDLKVLAQLGYGPVMEMSPEELAEWYLERSIPLIDRNRDVIAAVQIWNEPFNFPRVDKNGKRMGAWPARYGGRWFGGAYVAPFAEFSEIVAVGLRERFPDLVLVGGTKIPGSTLEMMQTTKPPLDAVYLQPYPRDWPPEWLRVLNDPVHEFGSEYNVDPAIDVFMNRTRQAAQEQDLALWITEIGATTYKAAPSNRNYAHPPVSEDLQAKIYARIWASYMAADVDRLFFFMLNDEKKRPQATMPQRHFAMIAPGWRPKPAYFVLARLNAIGGVIQPDPSIQWEIEGAAKFKRGPARELTGAARKLIPFTPDLQVRGFRTDRGWQMVAVWSDATFPSDKAVGPVRRLAMTLGNGFACEAISFDPLTGRSETLTTKNLDGRARLQLEVRDYPLLILTTKSGADCG